ncbi:hypothetical protein NKG94_11150 [Micromonospora sp. M12]
MPPTCPARWHWPGGDPDQGRVVRRARRRAGPAGVPGDTWDALSDVLRDRLDTGPLTLLITDAGQLLVDEPTEQYGLLLTVLGNLATSAPHPPSRPGG